MEQETITVILLKNADRHKYNDIDELAKDAYKMGASYIVMSWVDKYCLTRDLYRDNSWK